MSARKKILSHVFSTIFNWKTEPQRIKKSLNLKGSTIQEIYEVTEILHGSLYLSGSAPLTGQKLKELSVTAIICALTEIEEKHIMSPTYASSSIQKIYVRLLDSDSSELSMFFDPISNFIEDEIANGGVVLVHCMAGISRSPTLIMAYLMKYKNYNLLDAYDFVAEKRKIIQPNDGFCCQLDKYDRMLKESRSNSILAVKNLSINRKENERNDFPVEIAMENV